MLNASHTSDSFVATWQRHAHQYRNIEFRPDSNNFVVFTLERIRKHKKVLSSHATLEGAVYRRDNPRNEVRNVEAAA